jgi:hypothetical protein
MIAQSNHAQSTGDFTRFFPLQVFLLFSFLSLPADAEATASNIRSPVTSSHCLSTKAPSKRCSLGAKPSKASAAILMHKVPPEVLNLELVAPSARPQS